MKKRIISLLLALIMALSLLPVSVLAADDHTGQVHVTVENTTWAKADGAPWEGTLLDEWVTLKDDSTMMSCIVDALTAGAIPRPARTPATSAASTASRRRPRPRAPAGWAPSTTGSPVRALPTTP